jgi:hypothetical protein
MNLTGKKQYNTGYICIIIIIHQNLINNLQSWYYRRFFKILLQFFKQGCLSKNYMLIFVLRREVNLHET